jgi:hypothetical protein
MTTSLRVVSPYRPFVPESQAHQLLGEFDWVAALRMLRVSVTKAMGCDTVAITDVDTDLPGPTFHYETKERRLMLWITRGGSQLLAERRLRPRHDHAVA